MCLFCKIVKNELPSTKVYESETALAFMDIAPVNPGHVLIVPKEHYQNLEDAPEEVVCELIKVVKKIGKAVKSGLEVEGYNIAFNSDPVAGQIIPHLHFHVIPRHKDDGLGLWPGGEYGEGELENVLGKIKTAL